MTYLNRFASTIVFILFLTFSLNSQSHVSNLNIKINTDDYEKLLKFDEKNRDKIKVSVSIDNSAPAEATINFKGHTTMLFPKRGLGIKIKSDAFKKYFNNSTEISFNPLFTDKSFIREALTWRLFKELNGLGPVEYGYFKVYFNDTYQGLYLALQPINKELLKSKSLSDKYLFEAQHDVHAADLKILRDDYAKETYEKKSTGDIGYSKLFKMLKELNSAEPANFSSNLKNIFNIESIYNWFILNAVTMQGDTYVKNYYLQFEPDKAPSWSVIPWDYDLSFGRDGNPQKKYPLQILNDLYSYSYPVLNGPYNVIKDTLLTDSILLPEFKSKLELFLDKHFSYEKISKEIDNLTAEVSPFIELEPNSWSNVADFKYQIEALKYYTLQRSNYIKSQFLRIPKAMVYDQAEITITDSRKFYSFVETSGRTLAFIKFKNFKNLKSMTLKVQPSKTLEQLNNKNYIKRLVEIIPTPLNASFEAEIIWEYLDSPLITEVTAGVTQDYNLTPFMFEKSKRTLLKGHVNNFANLIFSEISQKTVGPNKYLGAMAKDLPQWTSVQYDSWLGLNAALQTNNYLILAADDGHIFKLNNSNSFESHKLPYRTKITHLLKVDEYILAADNIGQIIQFSNKISDAKYLNRALGSNLKDLILLKNLNILATTPNGKIYLSTDGGLNFTNVFNKPELVINSLTESDGNLILATSNGIYNSTDSGQNWTAINFKNAQFTTKYKNNQVLGWNKDNGKIFASNSDLKNLKQFETSFKTIVNLYYISDLDQVFLTTSQGQIYSSHDLKIWTLEHQSEMYITNLTYKKSEKTVYALSRNATLFYKKF